MKNLILMIAASCAFYGCATIQEETKVEQHFDTVRLVGVGDTVYSSKSSKNLPNVYGKADLFGRKTATGTTTVIYAGTQDGKAFFRRRTVEIETGATTMNSSGPLIIPNSGYTYHQGTIGGQSYSGTSYSQQPSTVIMPDKPETQYMDQGAVFIAVDLNTLPVSFIVEGVAIEVLAADELSAQVRLKSS